MKIETDNQGHIVLKEIYTDVMLETSEGNRLGICMRDDTFEINVMPKGEGGHCWQRVNMQTKTITRMYAKQHKVINPDGGEPNANQ